MLFRPVIRFTKKAGPRPPRAGWGFIPGRRSTAGRAVLGRVLAVDPRAFQLLVVRRLQQAALVAGAPAHHVVRLAPLLAAGLPPPGPAGVGVDRLAVLLVPEQRPPLAVAEHAHVHGRER